MDEYYKILGAKPGATPEDLKKAWKSQCKNHHPDKGGDTSKFRHIMHAYKMLTDASYRQETKQPDFREGLRVMFKIQISFEDAFFGRPVTVNYNLMEFDEKMIPVVKETHEIETMTIMVPPGSLGGFQTSFLGRGAKMGDVRGDLVIMVMAATNPRYRQENAHIVCEESVPLDVMLKGGTKEVETMYGMKTLKIPAGTQPGARLKVPHCGVAQQGHQYCLIKPLFPNEVELKTKKAWKDLKIEWETNKPEEDPEEQRLNNIFINLGGFNGRHT